MCPFEDALDDLRLPNPRILRPPDDVFATFDVSGFDPFLAAKS